MKVIICGAGQVGWQIARHLAGEKNDVTLVDTNADLVRRATDTLDVQGVAECADERVAVYAHPEASARAACSAREGPQAKKPGGKGPSGTAKAKLPLPQVRVRVARMASESSSGPAR